MTREHGLPEWVEGVFGAPGDFWVRMQGLDGRPIWSKPSVPRIDQKVVRVCRPCNGGWMSKLENDCKPLLTRMFRLEGAPVRLAVDAQRDIAFWAMKTALMMEFVHGDNHVPKEHYEWLYSHRDNRELPPGCFAWLAAYTTDRQLGWSFSRDLEGVHRISGGRIYGYLLTFAIGHLASQIGFFGADDTQPGSSPGISQIWPIAGWQRWPASGVIFNEDAPDQLVRRFDSADSHLDLPAYTETDQL